MTPTTVSKAFIKWLQDNGYGTFDPTGSSGDIFLNQVPDDAVDNAFWIVTSGGEVTRNLVTAQNLQRFDILVNYRNVLGEEVENKLFELSQRINQRGCFTIDGFDLYSIETTLPEDADRDAENRRQGTMVVAIQIYKSYVS